MLYATAAKLSKDRDWSREARAESTEARQLAKDAWQLAALEAAARPAPPPSWMVNVEDEPAKEEPDGDDGEE